MNFENFDNNNLIINAQFADIMQENNILTAKDLWDIESSTVKAILKERGTSKAVLKSKNGDVVSFIKRYQPIPLKEKIKNIICFKPYNFDALHEWNAIIKYHSLGIQTMTPIAVAKIDGCSCNLTLGISDYTRASELFENFTKKDFSRKRNLIKKMAEYVGKIHLNNMAHQDLYLVHFFIQEQNNDAIFLIDLQRTILADDLKNRWRIKDLGQLLFSSQNFVSKRDIALFWSIYCSIVRKEFKKNNKLINAIYAKAHKITTRDNKKRMKK